MSARSPLPRSYRVRAESLAPGFWINVAGRLHRVETAERVDDTVRITLEGGAIVWRSVGALVEAR